MASALAASKIDARRPTQGSIWAKLLGSHQPELPKQKMIPELHRNHTDNLMEAMRLIHSITTRLMPVRDFLEMRINANSTETSKLKANGDSIVARNELRERLYASVRYMEGTKKINQAIRRARYAQWESDYEGNKKNRWEHVRFVLLEDLGYNSSDAWRKDRQRLGEG
ncbi:hypothetical protein Slin14017_G117940 [Septoria linicola]|nr:hypothetical protein Slin14017_G117940 [Septoria linicola]